MTDLPTDVNNVLSINTETTKGKGKGAKADKPDPEDKPLRSATVEKDLCYLLEGVKAPLLYNAPDFPWTFQNIRDDRRDKSIQIQIEDNTATLVSIEYIASQLRLYVREFTMKQKDYALTQAGCERVVEAWSKLYIHRPALPKPLGFLSDPDLCLHRMGFDPKPMNKDELKKQAPEFSDYLERMTNSDAFCMRIGSMFDSRAHRKQSVWVEGPKDSGKSQLAALLCMLVGKSYTVISEEDIEEKFWKESIVGKRLVIFNEISPRFVRTAKFKNLTGDSLHRVRPFGGGSFMASLYPILFNFSNDGPLVQDEVATTERLIHCMISVIPESKRINEFTVLERMEREVPHIVNYCYGRWLTHPEGRDIPNDAIGKETLAAAVEEHEAAYHDFIAHYLEVCEPGSDRSLDCRVPAFHVQKLMTHAEIRSGTAQGLCKRVILRLPNVKEDRPRGEPNRPRYYVNLRIQPRHSGLVQNLLRETY